MVDERTQIPIDLRESVACWFTGEPSVSDMLANRGVVLALNEAIVVFLVGP